MPQPRIVDIKVDVDLHPEQRLATFRGTEWLENKTDEPIDRVAVTLWPEDADTIPRPHTVVKSIRLEGGDTPILEDRALGFFMYRLATPIPPHGRIALDFDLDYPNPGFVNSMPNGDIVHNGSFVNGSYLPFIGYLQDVQLVDDSARHRHGLQKVRGLTQTGGSGGPPE